MEKYEFHDDHLSELAESSNFSSSASFFSNDETSKHDQTWLDNIPSLQTEHLGSTNDPVDILLEPDVAEFLDNLNPEQISSYYQDSLGAVSIGKAPIGFSSREESIIQVERLLSSLDQELKSPPSRVSSYGELFVLTDQDVENITPMEIETEPSEVHSGSNSFNLIQEVSKDVPEDMNISPVKSTHASLEHLKQKVSEDVQQDMTLASTSSSCTSAVTVSPAVHDSKIHKGNLRRSPRQQVINRRVTPKRRVRATRPKKMPQKIAAKTARTSNKGSQRCNPKHTKFKFVTQVNRIDVLFGKGGWINKHPGNLKYHSAKAGLQTEYLSKDTSKTRKRELVEQLYREVVKNWGGRFLRRPGASDKEILVEDSGRKETAANSEKEQLWVEAATEDALEKCRQALATAPRTPEERAARRKYFIEQKKRRENKSANPKK